MASSFSLMRLIWWFPWSMILGRVCCVVCKPWALPLIAAVYAACLLTPAYAVTKSFGCAPDESTSAAARTSSCAPPAPAMQGTTT